jgi:hypothetical protein
LKTSDAPGIGHFLQYKSRSFRGVFVLKVLEFNFQGGGQKAKWSDQKGILNTTIEKLAAKL